MKGECQVDDIWYITKMRVTPDAKFVKKHRISNTVYFIEKVKYHNIVRYSLYNAWGRRLKNNAKTDMILSVAIPDINVVSDIAKEQL